MSEWTNFIGVVTFYGKRYDSDRMLDEMRDLSPDWFEKCLRWQMADNGNYIVLTVWGDLRGVDDAHRVAKWFRESGERIEGLRDAVLHVTTSGGGEAVVYPDENGKLEARRPVSQLLEELADEENGGVA